jgi:serine protease inhibitor
MKRCIALLLALCLVLPLAACAGAPAAAPANETEEPGRGPENAGKTPTGAKPRALALARYPEMAPYPDESAYYNKITGRFDDAGFNRAYDAWHSDKMAQRGQAGDVPDGLWGWLDGSIRQFLPAADGENVVYAPLNVYMALAMLAEATDGESRRQILALLGEDGIEALRTRAAALWNAHYSDDGATTSILANSLWLNEDVRFIQSTMDRLAEHYYASSFQGRMGSAEFDRALQDWINEQTGGLLERQAAGLQMPPETVLALASTIYFRAKWASGFSPDRTEKGAFHLPDGATVECDFMHKERANDYYWADRFSAVSLRLENSGGMWFLLPDEGVSVDELLSDDETMAFLRKNGDWANRKHLIVNMAVPKFDVSSDLDLEKGLRALGLVDVFDPAVSDFSPVTAEMDGIALSAAKHAARVAVDEEGVIAAAYTVMMTAGAAMPPEETVDFVLDRPFLFAITAEDGLPLFVGVVNRPAD